MRYLFRTEYRQNTALARHGGDRFWYGLLLVIMLDRKSTRLNSSHG